MQSIEATPNPALLVWARKTAGLSAEAAAKKAQVKGEQLRSWEQGVLRPSIAQLRKLASVYKRPLAAFYLPEPPTRFEVMHDFRRGSPEHISPDKSPHLSLEIRKAYDRREWALDLFQEMEISPPAFRGRLSAGVDEEHAAVQLRELLHVSLRQQSEWKADYVAFRRWRDLIEDAGVLTFQATGIEVREARGFSISLRPLPVVVVNIKDAPRGRVFTLLHEIVHLMLNQGGICDLHDAEVEAFCNRVAGAALFPRVALLSSDTVRSHSKGDPIWSDSELRALSRRFGGSREAALVRLLTLGLTKQSFYRSKRDEFLKQYEDQRNQPREGFAPPHQVALTSAGPLFTGLVMENFNRDRITASEVSDYLQIRVKHIADAVEFAKVPA